jgi:hypothetical protein
MVTRSHNRHRHHDKNKNNPDYDRPDPADLRQLTTTKGLDLSRETFSDQKRYQDNSKLQGFLRGQKGD